MLSKNAIGALVLFLFLPLAVNAQLAVSISSSPALPSTQSIGNVVAFNALATGGSGTYSTYTFSVFNLVTDLQVATATGTSNSYLYTVNGLAGDTQFANVVVTDSSGNTVTSTNTGILTVASTATCSSCFATLVNLGTSGDFVALAETTVTFTGAGSLIGDVGLSPAAASYFTGFSQTLSSTGTYATSTYVVGKMYAADYAAPTPADMTTAISNMQAAYTAGLGETNPTATELGAGDIGGMTLAPGLYKWSTNVDIPSTTTLTLDAHGNSNAIWVFQISGYFSNLGTIVLSGGAQAKNIFWVVAGSNSGIGAELGSSSTTYGTVLALVGIDMTTGAKLYGRALSQSAVTLSGATMVIPNGSAVAPFATNTMITVTTSSNAVAAGNTITFTANAVSNGGPVPNNGIITYYAGANVLGTGTAMSGLNSIVVSSCAASCTLVPGNYSITAVYAGYSDYAASTSNVISQAVIFTAALTTTTTTIPNGGGGSGGGTPSTGGVICPPNCGSGFGATTVTTTSPTTTTIVTPPPVASINGAVGVATNGTITASSSNLSDTVVLLVNGNIKASGIGIVAFNASSLPAGNYTVQGEDITAGVYSNSQVFTEPFRTPDLQFVKECSNGAYNSTSNCTTEAQILSVGSQLLATLYLNGVAEGHTVRSITSVVKFLPGTYTYVFNTTGNPYYNAKSITYTYTVTGSVQSSGQAAQNSPPAGTLASAPLVVGIAIILAIFAGYLAVKTAGGKDREDAKYKK